MRENERFYARICWNSGGWMRPTGEAAKLETNSHAAAEGFGYEEWLFNYGSQLDGYAYGFIQPIDRSRTKYAGKVIDLVLWAIDPDGFRVFVGEINNCEVLTDAQSLSAQDQERRAGLLQMMKLDVEPFRRKPSKASFDPPFNVRFKPADSFQIPKPYLRVTPNDKIARVKRYILTPVDEPDLDLKAHLDLAASKGVPDTSPYFTPGTPAGTVERFHAQLQGELVALLRKRYGRSSVAVEVGGIDILVRIKDKVVLIELKTYPVAKEAVREALGQLLEYCFFNPVRFSGKKIQLFIVGPGHTTKPCQEYIAFLVKQFGLPIHYCTFSKGSYLPPEMVGF